MRKLRIRDDGDYYRLAWFRYQLRLFLRLSERASRQARVTPQQHQLLLGIAGFTGRGWATISELAGFLQERHNAVVGLVMRASARGLVRKTRSRLDHRVVRVSLTRAGSAVLRKLTRLHIDALGKVEAQVSKAFQKRPRPGRPANWN